MRPACLLFFLLAALLPTASQAAVMTLDTFALAFVRNAGIFGEDSEETDLAFQSPNIPSGPQTAMASANAVTMGAGFIANATSAATASADLAAGTLGVAVDTRSVDNRVGANANARARMSGVFRAIGSGNVTISLLLTGNWSFTGIPTTELFPNQGPPVMNIDARLQISDQQGLQPVEQFIISTSQLSGSVNRLLTSVASVSDGDLLSANADLLVSLGSASGFVNLGDTASFLISSSDGVTFDFFDDGFLSQAGEPVVQDLPAPAPLAVMLPALVFAAALRARRTASRPGARPSMTGSRKALGRSRRVSPIPPAPARA